VSPVPAPLDARARRAGDSVVVTWRTAVAARRCSFVVVAGPSRRVLTDLSAVGEATCRGRTRFRVRLRSQDGRPLRWVQIRAYSLVGARAEAGAGARASGVRWRA
jgi:hypothetical protein